MDDTRTFLADTAHRQFRHSLMICDVLASLEFGIRADPNLRFISWPEILARAPDSTRGGPTPFRLPLRSGGYLVPDGLFGIQYGMDNAKTYRFFALEADRGKMPIARSRGAQTSYLGKITAYREIVSRRAYKSHWGIPNLLVLTLTTSPVRTREIIRRVTEAAVDNDAFLFKAISDVDCTVPAMHLLTEPWDRAALTALRIDE